MILTLHKKMREGLNVCMNHVGVVAERLREAAEPRGRQYYTPSGPTRHRIKTKTDIQT